jgi:hypothetical protein
VHNQDIIIAFEQEKKFYMLEGAYTYVFVGAGDYSKLAEIKNLIIARNLEKNIEDYKYLVDYTAWFALINNNIIKASTISLIQYDVSLNEIFLNETLRASEQELPFIIGYKSDKMRSPDFIRKNMGWEPLRKAVKATHGYDPLWPILKAIWLGKDKNWPCTNNICVSYDTLADFVNWFYPVALEIGNIPAVGHSFERSIKLYALDRQIKTTYLNGIATLSLTLNISLT